VDAGEKIERMESSKERLEFNNGKLRKEAANSVAK